MVSDIASAMKSTQITRVWFKPVQVFKDLLVSFRDIKSNLNSGNEESTLDETYFMSFLKKELRTFVISLEKMASQLEDVILALEGRINFSSIMYEIVKDLSSELVPQTWIQYPNNPLKLNQWMTSLKEKIEAINKYVQYEENSPLVLDISVFTNKNSMLQALVFDWSKRTGLPLHEMDVICEVCVYL